MLRRVVGDSMYPALKEGSVVLALKTKKPTVGSLVIVKNSQREIIKRVSKIKEDELYILGDNASQSKDSRDFGWVKKEQVLATVIWPNNV